MSLTILVTGATGHVGGACADALEKTSYRILRGTRRPMPVKAGTTWIVHPNLCQPGAMNDALAGVDVVLHFAGLAHVAPNPDSIRAATQLNVEATANLVTASAEAGAKRFVFISSALIFGPATSASGIISDATPPNPTTAYGKTKLQAEQCVREIAEERGMEWTSIRFPMVYGPGSPGNFARLVRMVDTGLPLPFGCATAPKSFIATANAVSAVLSVVENPAARNQAFLVADSEHTSTAGLISIIATKLGRRARLVPAPLAALRLAGRATGREREIASLLEPLAIDMSKIRNTVGWQPPVRLEDGIAVAVEHWKAKRAAAKSDIPAR